MASLIDRPAAVGLTIVSTLFKSEGFVEAFCTRAAAVARAFGRTYEIVLVNDGSPDRSLDAALVARLGRRPWDPSLGRSGADVSTLLSGDRMKMPTCTSRNVPARSTRIVHRL